jgi:hypothetical protein
LMVGMCCMSKDRVPFFVLTLGKCWRYQEGARWRRSARERLAYAGPLVQQSVCPPRVSAETRAAAASSVTSVPAGGLGVGIVCRVSKERAVCKFGDTCKVPGCVGLAEYTPAEPLAPEQGCLPQASASRSRGPAASRSESVPTRV